MAWCYGPRTSPLSWEGTRYKADPSGAADQATVAKCIGVRNTDSDKVAEAHPQDFHPRHCQHLIPCDQLSVAERPR